MEKNSYAARMRYLDAIDTHSELVDFEGLAVGDPANVKLGNIDGFIVDAETQRVAYVVINAGSWFPSPRLLLPIGHIRIGADRASVQVDVPQHGLQLFPEFEETLFGQFTDEELRAFERNTVLACCPDEPLEAVSITTCVYDSRRHYRQPDWWRNVHYAAERLQRLDAVGHVTDGGALHAEEQPASMW